MAKKHYSEQDNEYVLFTEDNIPKDFKDLDQTFRCPICASLFDKAVTIKECGHTFCSVCIRSYWVAIRNGVHRQEKSCPICRTTVNVMDVEKALCINRSVQEGVKAFKKLLLDHYESSKDQIEGCKRQRRSATQKQNKYSNGVEDNLCRNDSKKRDEGIPIKKKMQSRNYARMKKKELQSLCRELMIPTTGSEQELMNRLRNYQNMWNAEVLHSIDPKSPSAIASKLKKEEQAQREEKIKAKMNGYANAGACIKKLNASIRSGDKKTTSGNAAFDRELKANFKAMTAKLQLQMKKNLASPNIAANTSSNSDKPVGKANTKQLSSGVGEKVSMSVPDASCIECIDVESCSDTSSRSTRNLAIDLNQSSLPHSTASYEKKKKRSCEQLSSLSDMPKGRVPVDQRSVASRYK